MAGPGDAQLVSIYKNEVMRRVVAGGNTSFVRELLKPIDSFDPPKRTFMTAPPQGGLPPVQDKMVQRLTTIIAQAAAGNGSTKDDLFRDVVIGGTTYPGIMTIKQFMQLTVAQQLAVIDMAWNRVCKKAAYDRLSREMYEPTAGTVAPKKDPVPSGAIPGSGNGMAAGYFNAGRVPDAFTGLGVGFRVDGSGANIAATTDRVLKEGMTTQLKNRYLMYTIKGWEVQGTTVDLDTNAPRVWRTKDDLFNESAVCVSRNFYGATAFPMREMADEALLWAVDVGGLIGYDTEKHQIGLGRQWRPGEKAYKKIDTSRLIGYVKITKTGAPAEGGWKFKIDAGTSWTFLGGFANPNSFNATSREAQIRKYVTDQLTAWSGPERTISGDYDFA
jgi:hypothetical protein